MRSPFAILERRTNAAVLRALSNRRVRVPSLALDFDGMFDDASVDALNGIVESTQPRVTIAVSDSVLLARGVTLEILNPATGEFMFYEVATLEPDGAGFVTLSLRKA